MDHPFRNAAVGGFNKRDVLDYLEEQAKQATQVQWELKSELSGVRNELTALQSEHSELSGRLDQTRQELEAARQERDGLKARLEQSGRELADSQARAEALAKELEEVRRELEALRPDAQAYAEVKERTAGMELEAHRRAQAIEETAAHDAQKVRRQTEQWLQALERKYDDLSSQVESTVSYAASELGKVGASLEQLNSLMDSQSEALEGIRRAYDATAPDRVQAPMPLDEE